MISRRTVVALTIGALGAAIWASAPTPASGATAASQRAARGIIGIAPATRLQSHEYERIQVGAVRYLRVPIFWEDLQPAPGNTYDFSKTDEVAVYAAYYGMKLRPFVMGVPPWLQEKSGTTDYPPVSTHIFKRKWRALLTALVERYGPGGELWKQLKIYFPEIRRQPIRTWQVWNEPNAETYFRPRQTAAREYAKLLKLSAGAIRRADPGAKVIAAGVFLTPLDGITMPEFVRKLYNVPGIRDAFDALALHPYARNVGGVIKQIRLTRRLMKANKDEDSELWITELGWPTERSYGRGLFVKTEAGQKRMLARTFKKVLANRERWLIGSLTWYTWRDNDFFPNCDLCRFSGLFREDGTAKPAWNAFVNLTGGQAEGRRRRKEGAPLSVQRTSHGADGSRSPPSPAP